MMIFVKSGLSFIASALPLLSPSPLLESYGEKEVGRDEGSNLLLFIELE